MSDRDPHQRPIETDIEVQREHLADTVDQLAHKLDVKAQAKERAAQLKEQRDDRRRQAPAGLLARRRAGILATAGAPGLVAPALTTDQSTYQEEEESR